MFLFSPSCRRPRSVQRLVWVIRPLYCGTRHVFEVFRLGLGRFLRFFRPIDPPRSVPGHGLGNRAAKLWHRTVGFSCSILLRPPDSPPLGAGGVLGIFVTPTVAQGCVTFFFLLFGGIISPHPPSLRLWRYFGCALFRRHVFALPPLQVIWRCFSSTLFSVPYG